jgi:hypothetical protein
MSIEDIQKYYDREVELYRENPTDYQAGIVEGIKRVIELIQRENTN